MKKALIITTTSGFLSQFELNNVRLLGEMGYQIHYATNFGVPIYAVRDETLKRMGVVLHHISIEKNPFSLRHNGWALRELVRIIDREQIDVVHCHNPNGGVLGRLAASISRRKPYVIYTAHGFHFYDGAPLKNWLFYYPVEKCLAHYTDALITINREDYSAARKFRFKSDGQAWIIPGVGVDTEQFYPVTDSEVGSAVQLRRELNIPDDAFHIVSAGELVKNKNHSVVIKAIARLSRDDIYYSICGEGPYRPELEKLIEHLGLTNRVFLRGYREDMAWMWRTADLSIFPSLREGMGMAALEAMASSVPLVVADNRGTREYISDGNNGFACRADSPEEFAKAILKMYEDANLRRALSANALVTVNRFTLEQSEAKMREIYSILPSVNPAADRRADDAPLISVIMGVYNQLDLEGFEKAVDSVLNQTLKDFEFLIYNDGSSDREVIDYIDSLESRDSRIRVINSAYNHGLGYALNRCIEEARGKYLARMDADDISHPDRFAIETRFLEEHSEYMWCGSGCELFDTEGVWGNSTRPEDPQIEDYLKYSPYIHPTVMYRATLFESVAGYSETRAAIRCEDYELFMRLFSLGYRGYNLQTPLLNYRVDRRKYHSRSFMDCINESKIRSGGFRRLGVSGLKRFLYSLRPMASKLIPTRVIINMKVKGAEP